MTEQTDLAPAPPTGNSFRKTLTINAPPATVWTALTTPASMKQWMAEIEIEISTDWRVGSPIVICGTLHRVKFENKGRVLQFNRAATAIYPLELTLTTA